MRGQDAGPAGSARPAPATAPGSARRPPPGPPAPPPPGPQGRHTEQHTGHRDTPAQQPPAALRSQGEPKRCEAEAPEAPPRTDRTNRGATSAAAWGRGCHGTRETQHDLSPRAWSALSPPLRFQTGSSNCRAWPGPSYTASVGWGWRLRHRDTKQLQLPRAPGRVPRAVPPKDQPQDGFWTDARLCLALPAHQTKQVAKAGLQAAARQGVEQRLLLQGLFPKNPPHAAGLFARKILPTEHTCFVAWFLHPRPV